MPLPSLLVGVVLLTVGLIRARVVPRWAAVGLSVAMVLNVITFSSANAAGVAASWAVLLVAMGSIGRSVLTRGTTRGVGSDAAQAQTA